MFHSDLPAWQPCYHSSRYEILRPMALRLDLSIRFAILNGPKSVKTWLSQHVSNISPARTKKREINHVVINLTSENETFMSMCCK